MAHQVWGGEFGIEVGDRAEALSYLCRGGKLGSTATGPTFVLAGKPARPVEVRSEGGAVIVPLRGDGVEGVWRLEPCADGVTSVVEMAGAKTDVAVEIELPLPLEAAMELPMGQNWAVRIDKSCPAGREQGRALGGGQAQLAAAELAGRALAFIGLSDHTRYLPGTYAGVWQAGGYRDEKNLRLHLKAVAGERLLISLQPDLEGVIDLYCRSLRRRLGMLTMAEDPSVPDWLGEIKAIVLMSMWHSNGTILHKYSDALRLAEDLKSLGIRGGVLVRLTCWQAPFDAGYPFYDPPEELGGPAGLRAFTDTLHANGNRFSVHSNIWGMDPYHERFEEIEHLAVPYDRVYERIPTGQIGPYDGWPGPYPALATGFDTGAVRIEMVEMDESHATFETPELPEAMEAYLTVFGVTGFAGGRLRAVVGNRQVTSPPGTFARDDRCRLRFRFRFAPGRNRIRLDFIGGRPELAGARYRLNGAVRPERVWSHPIVRADVNHPQWAQVTCDNLGRVAREYGIDVPYLDAVNIWRPSDRGVFDALRQALPGKVFGCEYSAELGYNMFRMTKVMVANSPAAGSPLKLSDFARRVHERFTRLIFLNHHFSTNHSGGGPLGFDVFGSEKSFEGSWALAEGPSKGVIPCIRVDYRGGGGLDEQARKFLLSL